MSQTAPFFHEAAAPQTKGRLSGSTTAVLRTQLCSQGAAAAWMMNGMVQCMLSSIVPGNRNLDNTSPELQKFTNLHYPNSSLQLVRAPAQHGLSSNRMALITSDPGQHATLQHQVALTTSDCAPSGLRDQSRPAQVLRVRAGGNKTGSSTSTKDRAFGLSDHAFCSMWTMQAAAARHERRALLPAFRVEVQQHK